MSLPIDPKREVLRHMVATVAFRGRLAVSDSPENFAEFRASDASEMTRTPAQILAHIGDLLEGTLYILQGELRYIASTPLRWDEEVTRFNTAAKRLDSFLASDASLACPVEKLVQGPIGDALTHVGQIVMLRRLAGKPVPQTNYFKADIS